MISKSFHQRQQLEELSFKKQNQTISNVPRRNLSQTQATDEDDLNDTLNSNDSQDNFQEQQQMIGNSARDALLLKCRDAIESLHLEIEEERTEKQRLTEQYHELQRFNNDLQMNDQEKDYRIQKMTEDAIQMQSDILVLTKEKERIQYERDDYERQNAQIEPLQEEVKRLQSEKIQLLDYNRKVEAQNEVLRHEKAQNETQISMFRKDKDDLAREINELRDQLYSEQKKIEINYRQFNDQLQEVFIKEQERRESEVKRERDERKQAEKEYQNKLDELQIKMERLLREQQKEQQQENDQKLSEILNKNTSEISKYVEQIQKLQQNISLVEQQVKSTQIEKHQLEIKIIELQEQFKSERSSNERQKEAIGYEKEQIIAKYEEEISSIKKEQLRVELEKKHLEKELQRFQQIEGRFEDLQAECLTLQQTNQEYKKNLQSKVREIFNLQKEQEQNASVYQKQIDQVCSENHNLQQKIESIQYDRQDLTCQIQSLETLIQNKEKQVLTLKEEIDEERDHFNKKFRQQAKEMTEWQEQVKLIESQKFDLSKRLTQLEEAYKRDSHLFRTETIKRDEEYEDQKLNLNREVQNVRMQNEQSIEFIKSIKKDLIEIITRADKKNEQYIHGNHISEQTNENMDNMNQNNRSYKYVLQTVIESFKRSQETICKRIDSFIYYAKSTQGSKINVELLDAKSGHNSVYHMHQHNTSSTSINPSSLKDSNQMTIGGDLFSTVVSQKDSLNQLTNRY
ncbi:UNKNOWN [Stylonychia lemnae]|uniref:Uncharacterized protein n=1 Tax=Stylonychia lemnae TaxID=5949 RepID=A0A077ZTM9_STYLE|nr:UNKNOWN [Stylonychia lemnae]|eukprot:CDW72869.1 UNKNOWN [Stylonychia lemnae]